MVDWPAVKDRVIQLAEAELELWTSMEMKEYDAAATSVLRKYWRSVKNANEARKIVEELQADPAHLIHPWSAAFISWVMKTAGATKFKKSPSHHVYVADAKHNREDYVTDNPFWAYRISEVKPQVGDLVCQRRCLRSQYQNPTERPKKCATYATIDDADANGKPIAWRTHCDIVTRVRGSSIDVIGGNISNAVSRKTIPLDSHGHVKKKTADENQYIAIVKFRDTSTVAEFEVHSDPVNSKLNSGAARGERCTAGDDVIDFLDSVGSGLNRQVRIKHGSEFALYTLIQRHSGTGVRIGSAGLARIGLEDPTGVYCTLDTRTTNSHLSAEKARDASELIERITGFGNDLIALAPHGGDIEKFTDEQALRVQKSLGNSVARSWRCMGWKNGGGASERWHITSTEISELSFPLLSEIFDQQYAHAVAFHGWTKNYIGVGGRAPQGVRQKIVDEIRSALAAASSTIEVKLESGGGLSGSSRKNIVNRITANRENGVHIEQSREAREKHWKRIADAVTEVYRGLILPPL